MGFNSNSGNNSSGKLDNNNVFKNVVHEDLVEFGIIPELIRLPVVSTMSSLSDREMLKILTDPKNALLRQYKKLFQMENVILDFEQKALSQLLRLLRAEILVLEH